MSLFAGMKKILFPTEFGPLGEKARDTVVYLAEKTHAHVWLMHAVPHTNVVTRLLFGADPERDEHEATRQLDACADRLNQNDRLEIHTVVGVGRPEAAIVEAAKNQEVDLIVFGTKGDTGWLTDITGTAVNYVIQHAPCPVLTLLKKPQNIGFDRILVVTDPTQESLVHLDWAFTLGSSFKFVQHYNPKKTALEVLATAETRIVSKTKVAGISGIEIQDIEQSDDPEQDIFQAAAQFKADLIVVMEFNWDTEEEEDTAVGSLVAEIVEHSEIPVLTVRNGHSGPK